jgi:Protein of unknown function (DUF3108)
MSFQLNNTSSKSPDSSCAVIDFKGARVLCVVVFAHMAALWWWLADAPAVVQITQAVIVQEPAVPAKSKTQEAQISLATLGASEPPQAPSAPFALPAQQPPHLPSPISPPSPPSPPSPAPLPIIKTAALEIPASIQLHYALTKGNNSAETVLTWRTHFGDPEQLTTYDLTLEVNAGFLTPLQQTSTGHVTSQGLAPIRYADKRLRKPEQATHFDEVAGIVTFSNNRPKAVWRQGVQDRLSVLVQLAAMVQGRSAVPSGSHGAGFRAGDIIELPVASTDELELWLWEVQPAVDLDAGWLKLQRHPRRAYDAQIELWLSPALGYLPARIRQTDSSGVTDQVLTRAL